jgi:hypothetical protein
MKTYTQKFNRLRGGLPHIDKDSRQVFDDSLAIGRQCTNFDFTNFG